MYSAAVNVTPECERLGLGVHPITTEWDVESLRILRNLTKEGFSFDNDTITPDAQRGWWAVMQGKVQAWLYIQGTRVVGFGVLRQTEDGRWWSSVGVPPEHAGHGYGGAITADLVRRIDCPVWATARLDNPAAMRLHRPEDWYALKHDERLAHYMTRPHVYGPARRESFVADGVLG